jgi:hypothetical protein
MAVVILVLAVTKEGRGEDQCDGGGDENGSEGGGGKIWEAELRVNS